MMQVKCAGIHGNPESTKTTWHCHSDKSMEILTNRHTNQGDTTKTRKGGAGEAKRHSTMASRADKQQAKM